MGSPLVCRSRSTFAWQGGRRCCVAFSPSLHACLVGATSSVGLVGLSLYFLTFPPLFPLYGLLLDSATLEPARLCGSCLYPNDADANFCQACGVPTAPLVPAVPLDRGPVDEKVIQERFHEFKSSFERRSYQRQKSALEQQLSMFLASVSPPKTISSCTVDDVIKFLIYKDSSGRTVVHVPTCPGGACTCPAV